MTWAASPAEWAAELRGERAAQRAAQPVSAYAEIDRSIAAAAQARIAAQDPEEVPVELARDWAALFALAEQHDGARRLLARHLAWRGPAAEFPERLEFLLAAVRAGDGEALYEQLKAMPIPTSDAATLASHFGGSFHHYVMTARGPEACLMIAARIRNHLPEGPFADDETRKQHGWARRQLAATEALYLAATDRREEAVAVLDHALATLDSDIFRRDGLQGDRQRYLLLDRPAPELPAVMTHGTFEGLEAYRGRVVLLEFTAHWCHACHKAIPGLIALDKELAGEDFAILAVTTFYGFFKSEYQRTRDMPRDQEFARMPALLKEQGVTWPIVYVERDTFRDYGVTGIPQFMVIDKTGVIRAIDTGYSEAKFGRLKDRILELLAE
jgi:thiol-disulfide isomerase/thioredoxin